MPDYVMTLSFLLLLSFSTLCLGNQLPAKHIPLHLLFLRHTKEFSVNAYAQRGVVASPLLKSSTPTAAAPAPNNTTLSLTDKDRSTESSKASTAAPHWKDYLHWLPEETNSAAYLTDDKIRQFPIKSLQLSSNQTITYREAYEGGTKYVDPETYGELLKWWDPKALERAKKAERDIWDVPEDAPDDAWIPIPASAYQTKYDRPPVKIETDVDGYDYIITYFDPSRNYTWSYKRYNPLKVGNQSSIPRKPWKSTAFEDERYYLKNVSPPKKELDTGLFRKPTLTDQMVAGINPNAGQAEQPNYIQQNPYGVVAEYQKENKGNNPEIRYLKLGNSGIAVSEIGLGTMTFGLQVDEALAFTLLDFAYDEFNVNFFDTAELYPLPAQKSTYGVAESILGKWLKYRTDQNRQHFIIATKVAGRSDSLSWLRGDGSKKQRGTCLTKQQIIAAVEGSLKRLKTDYIDILQFHWPDRYVPMHQSGDFPDILYDNEVYEGTCVTMEEQLEAIDALIRQGKIREWGLSNETPWGVMKFWQLAKDKGFRPPVSVQLNYNLLCRNDLEKGFVELVRPDNTGIFVLAYGPLAGGVLSGKYLEHLEYPTTGRMLRFPSYMKRFRGSIAARAVREYHNLAMKHEHPNLSLTSLRWVYTRPFVGSTIIGANDIYQLRENLWALNDAIALGDTLEREINALHWKWRDPIRIIQ